MNTTRRTFLLAAGSSMGMSALLPGANATAGAAPSGGPDVVVVPERKVPLLAKADVLVCGGGPAGVTTACSAARHGASVILIERWPCLGGMGTAALVNIWHRCDREKIVINGLVEEAIDRARKRGWIERDSKSLKVYESHWFDPEGMKIVFQDMLDEAGVRTFGYTVAGEPIVEGGKIRGVLVDSKQGRRAILAKIVIDATGDGDIAAKAGCDFDYGRAQDGRVQGMTMMYRLCGIDEVKVKSLSPQQVKAIHAEMVAASKRGELPPFNTSFSPAGQARNRNIPNMCPAAGNPLSEEELTRLTANGRRRTHAYWEWLRSRMPGLEHVRIEQTGFALGIRESRRITGLKTLDRAMVLGAAKQPDALGHGFWGIDIHDPTGSGYTTWNDQDTRNMLPVGQSYHIPLGMCLNPSITNLAVVGRCASSTHEGHASVRLQSHCMVMGQGVGTCAAMALHSGIEMAQVDVGKLQATLKKDGVYLQDVPQMFTGSSAPVRVTA